MKKTGTIRIVISAGLLLMLCSMLSSPVWAQAASTTSSSTIFNFPKFNPPPFDFNDAFYGFNGMDVNLLDSMGQRFGTFNGKAVRQTGPPAFLPGQLNWVTDNSNTDPDRNNVRILATTGGYPDDGTGTPTEFISIIAFVTNQNFFLPAPIGFNPPDTNGNARQIHMSDIVSNFEAYAALRQRDPVTGKLDPTPCGTMFNNSGTGNLPANTPCFNVTSVATPSLRQDWRFATNRNAIDGSDNNAVTGSGTNAVITNNTPYGYFCDDLLGMWIITYIWYNENSVGNPADGTKPTQQCLSMLASLAKKNGINLDGTPIIKTADETNFLEGSPEPGSPIPGFPGSNPPNPACGEEGQEDVSGADGGAVWLICPAIPDPRNGAIAPDAFLDQVRTSGGIPIDPGLTLNFTCLKFFGAFCSELTASQVTTAQMAAATAATGPPSSQ
ncbi:MAG TPA: hypothetical protein VOA88_19085 [Candidatus Dormibacteraeota bacterium]|nr:hypothetical protein [Candidatus Dormibacteraeota bacterium]